MTRMINIDNNNEIEAKSVWNLSSRNLADQELHLLEKRITYNPHRAINRSEVIFDLTIYSIVRLPFRKSQMVLQNGMKILIILQRRKLEFQSNDNYRLQQI